MNFVNKLNDTYKLLSSLDDLSIVKKESGLVKNLLLSASEDLAKYKDIDEINTISKNDQIKSKIIAILAKINRTERNVKNKLILTEKYNSYLNS